MQFHAGQNTEITFKYVTTYNLIWKDSGSEADREVSIWQPQEIEHGYYPLGDVATASHGKPGVPAMTVSAKTSNSLAPPFSFTEVWNDRGSDADTDVRVMKMIPRYGYTCLGHIAVVGYSSTPNKNQYRYIILYKICIAISYYHAITIAIYTATQFNFRIIILLFCSSYWCCTSQTWVSC